MKFCHKKDYLWRCSASAAAGRFGRSKTRSPAVARKDALQPTVPVAVLTLKVIQGQRFSSHLKGRMRLPILVINSNLDSIPPFPR